MNYEEFLHYVQRSTENVAGEGGKVTISHVMKNNGKELDGLVNMEAGSHISPTIYLNSFYDQYLSGRSLDDIVEEVTGLYYENRNRIVLHPDYFSEFAHVSDRIVYKIVNFEKNARLLEEVPYKKILDLAVIFYCLLDQKEDGNATALIYNKHLAAWDVTIEEIYQKALVNTPVLLKSRIQPMSDVIREIMHGQAVACGKEEEFEAHFPAAEERQMEDEEMFVLSNEEKINGAACILYEDVLKEFSGKMGTDLYILPSSIHEVILLPVREQMAKEELSSMVNEVNREEVSYEEVLYDHVYIYNQKSGVLSM